MNYISIKQVLDDILDDEMMSGLTLERAVNYTQEFIKIIGMPKAFDTNTALVEINNYRGELPCDFYKIIQVRKPNGIAYIASSNDFSNEKDALTYVIKGNVIFTSTKDETVEISYNAIKVDSDGFPLIPDNGTFARALELYIQKKYFTKLFNKSKIPQAVLQNTQQEYAFSVGQAQSDLVKPTIDEMEAIKNMWNTLIPKMNKHMTGFKTLNEPEIKRF